MGLRYEALPFVMRAEGIPRAEWPQAFLALQILERETVRLARKG